MPGRGADQHAVGDDVRVLGEVGVQGVRHVRRDGHRADRALGEGLDDRSGAERERQVGHRLGPRAGHGVVPERLEGQHELDRAGAHAAVLLGDDERVHALLGEPSPDRQPRGGVVGGPGAGGGDGVGAGQQPVQGGREVLLLRGVDEPHRPAPFGSRGRPRMRSATMLRWISLVPA